MQYAALCGGAAAACRRAALGMALALSLAAPPARAVVISKGSLIHPGGNFCTTRTLATFVSSGADLIVIYEDIPPLFGPSITISPSPPQHEDFVYTQGTQYTVTTYRGLTAGQQYTCTYQRCGGTLDIDAHTILENGCPTGPAPQPSTCYWEDVAVHQPIIRFKNSPVILGHTVDKSVRLENTGTQVLSATITSTCPEFSIVGNPAVSVPAGNGLTLVVRYTPTIDDVAAGALTPRCLGSLLLGTGIGPRVVFGSATDVLRVRLDGSADRNMGTGAGHMDFAIDTVNSDCYQARWSAGGTADGIYSGNLDGLFVRIVQVSQPWCVDVDPAGGKLYWAAANHIRRSNLDGSSVQDLPVPVIYPGGPIDLAIDPAAGRIYWTEVGVTNFIKRANLDGSGPITLATLPGGGNPRLALDRTSGRLYWSEDVMARIRRMNVDGSNAQTLVTPGIASPAALAVDPGAGKLYWLDTGTNSLHRVDLGGQNHQEIVPGITGPTGLTLILPEPNPSGVEQPLAAPPAPHLDVPRPNPFNPATTIAFVHGGGSLALGIYSAGGRLVRTLYQGNPTAGSHTLVWDGKDDHGAAASSGVYFVKLQSAGLERSTKAVLVR